jgi:hypothetical protein
LKCYNEKDNYEFFENDDINVYRPRVIVYREEQDFMFRVYYESLKKSFDIDVCVDNFSTSPFFIYFRLFQNFYVYENLRETICVWTRLNIKYKNLKYCDNILNEYILYKEKNIEDYLKIIEMGSRFRSHCLLHKFPLEVRKSIYDAVVRAYCDENVMECEAFAHTIFPS